jgi:FixJ family two-component response regulator
MTPLQHALPDRPQAVVHLIEDDELSRRATVRVLTTAGYVVSPYASADEFLAVAPADPGCLVLDLQLPGLNGLGLQERVCASANPLPIVFLTGHGGIPDSVRAMKNGAVDFLTKPVSARALLNAVDLALARDDADRATRARRRETRMRYERLTPREREVFAHVIAGQLNKQIAFDLGTIEHTIKVHRSRVMQKLEALSVADLVRMAGDLGVEPVGEVR